MPKPVLRVHCVTLGQLPPTQTHAHTHTHMRAHAPPIRPHPGLLSCWQRLQHDGRLGDDLEARHMLHALGAGTWGVGGMAYSGRAQGIREVAQAPEACVCVWGSASHLVAPSPDRPPFQTTNSPAQIGAGGCPDKRGSGGGASVLLGAPPPQPTRTSSSMASADGTPLCSWLTTSAANLTASSLGASAMNGTDAYLERACR